MIGIIWGSTLERAVDYLEHIEKAYDTAHIPIVCKSIRQIEFSNGDIWKAVKADHQARGRRCDISYIDCMIPMHIIEDIIVPSTKNDDIQIFAYTGDNDGIQINYKYIF